MSNKDKSKNTEWVKYLSGTFLLRELWVKNLPFVLYLLFLSIVAINAAHKAERKVHEIARLSNKHKEVKSEYIETKSLLMQMSSETKVIEKAKDLGLRQNEKPPIRIVVNND